MAKNKQNPEKFFNKLTRLFKGGVTVKRKIRSQNQTVTQGDTSKSSGTLLFQKSFSPTYARITGNAYNITERLARFQDFQEMEQTSEISTALDLYADESAAVDDKGRALHVFSDNEKIKQVLEELFYNTINIEFNLRSWVRNLLKFGDLFLLNDVHHEKGVVNVYPIPVNEIEREEGYDREDPMAVRFRWISLGNRILENWEVSHFRLLGNDQFLPYGTSVIESTRRIWRQLILIEDAMLVYRVVRAPERRVFYIDVANLAPNDIPHYMELQKQQLKMNQVADATSNRVDVRYNPLSVDEDFYIPIRGSESGTRIDTLAAGQNTGTVEDVAYIQKKLVASLKVPKAYLGFDEGLASKASLAQMDIRFSRSISIIQKTIIAELNKLAIIHLYTLGFQNEDLANFTLRLSNPSTVAEQQKLELWRTKFDIGGTLPEGYGSKTFVYKKVWGLTDEEIEILNKERVKETLIDATIAAMAEGESAPAGGGGGGGGGSGGGGGLADLGAGGDDVGGDEDIFSDTEVGDESGEEESSPEPEEENASEEPAEEEDPELDLLTSGDDAGDGDSFKIPSMSDTPVKISKQLKKYQYNNSRRRHHGSSKTHMPDFNAMVNHSKREDTMNDPFDNNWLKSVVSNPFGESVTHEKPLNFIPADVMSTLKRMNEKFSQLRNETFGQPTLLSEGRDVQDQIDNDLTLELDFDRADEFSEFDDEYNNEVEE